MNKILLFFSFSFISLNVISQDIYEDVYTIFQNSCMPCHNSATQTAGLNLEGNGASVALKMADVYASLYKQLPSNTAAVNNKNFLIYPGDPYRSFLYRKIDNDLTPGLMLHAGEGASEPNGNSALSDKEIELVRQWILYGAQESGTFFDKTLLENYYDNGGVESIENPPMPPAEGEGFQIHLGPFYLEAGGEVEYFSKYESLFDSNLEVYKLQTEMGDFSHHYIVYKFTSDFGNVDPDLVPYGMRSGQDFDGREFVSVDQYSGTLNLPEGTAFKWEQNTVFDLNIHYINYSSTQVLKCEVFYNVYTQDVGTANQEMEVALIPNDNIPIPNDNVPITFSEDFQLAFNADIHIWGLVAHTHQYGKDFNIYKKNINGTRGVQLYDAGCANGIPGCNIEDFDYSHLPIKYNYPFETINVLYGIEYEATYQNDGPVPVNWGYTSNDEMMIFIAFYVTDTTGIDMTDPNTSVGIKAASENEKFKLYPNPSNEIIYLETNSSSIGNYTIEIVDVAGRIVFERILNTNIQFNVSKWSNGLYFYSIKNAGEIISKGKFAKN